MTIQEILNKHNITTNSPIYCNNGWSSLIDDFFAKIIVLGWIGEVTQIKEKFGGLKLYITNAKSIRDSIVKYEYKSYSICEECGMDGALYNDNGIYKTRCDAHGLDRNNLCVVKLLGDAIVVKGFSSSSNFQTN